MEHTLSSVFWTHVCFWCKIPCWAMSHNVTFSMNTLQTQTYFVHAVESACEVSSFWMKIFLSSHARQRMLFFIFITVTLNHGADLWRCHKLPVVSLFSITSGMKQFSGITYSSPCLFALAFRQANVGVPRNELDACSFFFCFCRPLPKTTSCHSMLWIDSLLKGSEYN